jgi:SAM-dependent methyltransferase
LATSAVVTFQTEIGRVEVRLRYETITVIHMSEHRADSDRSTSHALSFGAAAAAYAEHRPDYAIDAVRWALALAPGATVLDLGAGTGKLTRTLIDLGAEVVAVEPDPAMMAELLQTVPTVRAFVRKCGVDPAS